MGLGVGVAADKRSPEHFFRPVESPVDLSTLDADQVFPRGKLFLFSHYSVGGGSPEKSNDLMPEEYVQEDFKKYIAEGYKVFGPQYELNDRALEDAEKHNLKVVYSVGLDMNFHKKGDKPALDLTPEEIDKQVREQIAKVADNKHIAVWDLRPEELRPWRKKEMEYLEVAAKAVRETDPLKRPIFQYDPAHATKGRLASTIKHLDFSGRGTYTNYSGHKNERIFVLWSMEQMKEAIKEANPNGHPLAVLEGFRQPDPEELGLIDTWVRHDSYLGMVGGAKGILMFSRRLRPKFDAWGDYMKAYAQVNKELTGELGLANVFLFGEWREDISVDVYEGPEQVDFTFPSAKITDPIKYNSVNFADIAYGDKRYLFIVNSAEEPVSVYVGGISYNSAMAKSLFHPEDKDFLVGEGEFAVDLKPLEVRAYEFSRKQGN